MRNLFEVVGSSFIGGFFIYMILSFNIRMSDTFNDSVINNKNLFDTIEFGILLNYDFNKIGYRVDSDIIFSKTKESEFYYFGDLDDGGVVDSIHYVLGSTADASETSNPDDKPLYRIINDTDTTTNFVNNFEIVYIDSAGAEITPTSSLNSPTPLDWS